MQENENMTEPRGERRRDPEVREEDQGSVPEEHRECRVERGLRPVLNRGLENENRIRTRREHERESSEGIKPGIHDTKAFQHFCFNRKSVFEKKKKLF